MEAVILRTLSRLFGQIKFVIELYTSHTSYRVILGAPLQDLQVLHYIYWEELWICIKINVDFCRSKNSFYTTKLVKLNFSSKVHFYDIFNNGRKVFACFACNDHQGPPPPPLQIVPTPMHHYQLANPTKLSTEILSCIIIVLLSRHEEHTCF